VGTEAGLDCSLLAMVVADAVAEETEDGTGAGSGTTGTGAGAGSGTTGTGAGAGLGTTGTGAGAGSGTTGTGAGIEVGTEAGIELGTSVLMGAGVLGRVGVFVGAGAELSTGAEFGKLPVPKISEHVVPAAIAMGTDHRPLPHIWKDASLMQLKAPSLEQLPVFCGIATGRAIALEASKTETARGIALYNILSRVLAERSVSWIYILGNLGELLSSTSV